MLNDNGINVSPTPITAGSRIEVEYDGLLSKSGAQEVYLHAGFGIDDNWEKVLDLKMERGNGIWKTNCDVNTSDRFIFCFHDNAGNWDNNDGRNWSFEVHDGRLY